MAVVRLLKSLCILVPVLFLAASSRPALAAPSRVALVGIFHDTGDSPSTQSKLLTDEVSQRLRILGFDFATVPKTSATCRTAECLAPLLREVGADLAITGIVFRTHELCTASLYVQDAKTWEQRSADIRCQPDTGDEALAVEFADTAGRMSESLLGNEMFNSSIKRQLDVKPDYKERTNSLDKKNIVGWKDTRKIIAVGMGLTFVGLLTAGIYLSIHANGEVGKATINESATGSQSDFLSVQSKINQTTGFLIGAGFSGAMSGIVMSIPVTRR